jgi:hypothetical protein
MTTHAPSKLPAELPIGKSTIRLEQDERATLHFIHGLTAGILTYEVHGKKARLYDTDLILMIVAHQQTRHQSLWFNSGFVVGNLSSIARKGVSVPTDTSFCQGYQDGKQADGCLSQKHIFTASELCSLFSWQHTGQNSAFHCGYITGFIQGLTNGRDALSTRGRVKSNTKWEKLW